MKIQSVPNEIQANSNLETLINELNFNEKSFSSDLYEIKTVCSKVRFMIRHKTPV